MVCPQNTSFLNDPWCFEFPFTFKPMFLNMDFNLDQIQVNDLVFNHFWDNSLLEDLFGFGLNSQTLKLGWIDPNSSVIGVVIWMI